MKAHQSAKGFWSFLLTVSLIGVLIGVLLIAIPTDFLIKLAFILLGVITLISAIPELASGLVNLSSREGKLSLIFSFRFLSAVLRSEEIIMASPTKD